MRKAARVRPIITFTVSLSAASGLPASVEYNTANGTATAASGDYAGVSATALNFAAGETSKTLTVNVNGDTTYEADESFTVHLGNASGAMILDSDGTGMITNDDAAPGLSIGDFTFTGADSGGGGRFCGNAYRRYRSAGNGPLPDR